MQHSLGVHEKCQLQGINVYEKAVHTHMGGVLDVSDEWRSVMIAGFG